MSTEGTVDRVRDATIDEHPRLTTGVVLVGLLALPFVSNPFWTRFAGGALMWIGLAQSWNMIGGYTGYLDFGHGAFYGVGRFATGIIMSTGGLPFLVALPLAAVAGAVLAYVVGRPTLRLKGAYFAIATWVFAEGMKQLALVLKVTGGTYGLSLPTSPASFGVPVIGGLSESLFYYLFLIFTVATVAVVYFLFEEHEFGYRVKAIRDHEDAAESLGINSSRVKRQVYVPSCAIAALFGSINAYHVSFIHPNDQFATLITDQMVIMVLIGGLGTVLGPILGGLLVFSIIRIGPLFFGSSAAYLPIIGLLIRASVLLTPNGVLSLLNGTTSLGDVRENVQELATYFDIK